MLRIAIYTDKKHNNSYFDIFGIKWYNHTIINKGEWLYDL